jgi:hypothetical protein
MKYLLFALGIVVATAATGTRAEAQNYPWCAYLTGKGGGARNCGFANFQQCMEDVSGLGGFCEPNTQYQPSRPKKHSHRRT